jgi:hypothetical protein
MVPTSFEETRRFDAKGIVSDLAIVAWLLVKLVCFVIRRTKGGTRKDKAVLFTCPSRLPLDVSSGLLSNRFSRARLLHRERKFYRVLRPFGVPVTVNA